jgi:hypothetical protein
LSQFSIQFSAHLFCEHNILNVTKYHLNQFSEITTKFVLADVFENFQTFRSEAIFIAKLRKYL